MNESTTKTKSGSVENIKMKFLEKGGGGMDWIDLDSNSKKLRAVVSAGMNLRVP
jgi:hypothetical protein